MIEEKDMSKKKAVASFVGGGAFALTVVLVAGFTFLTWQFWAILLSGMLTKLPDLFD
jgi:hypothetical protein